MFQSYLLKGAITALTVIELIAKARNLAAAEEISQDDCAAMYPEFAAAMQLDGSGFEWSCYPVQTATGYNVLMYRLTADSSGVALEGAKGPLLLLHGMFSDPTDWIKRTDLS